MLENLFGHTWCNCLECDQRVEALRALIVGRGNRDDNLMIALIHFSHGGGGDSNDVDTTYHVFNESYYLLHPYGDIQDPQLVNPDEDDDDDWDEDEDEDDL